MKSIFALVDCNNFYASCEKLFDPKLKDRPVVVLSNNDGCVVARSAEVKALGIPMGVPWFQIQAEARRYGIVAFSSNYALYADMSNRVVEVLSDFSPNLEVYSIDESFLDLSGMSMRTESLAAYGVEIRQRVADWLGLAVCVGIAPTKTLAKLANHCAKKGLAGADGVCDFTTLSPGALSHLFARIEVGEVWGVGRQIKARLAAMGIQTVGQLRDADAETIRARFSVVLERTVSELRGESCLDLRRWCPTSSKSCRAGRLAPWSTSGWISKKRWPAISPKRPRSCVRRIPWPGVQVYIRTNVFKPEVPQYQKGSPYRCRRRPPIRGC
jgi:DNA polymerase V